MAEKFVAVRPKLVKIDDSKIVNFDVILGAFWGLGSFWLFGQKWAQALSFR